MASTSPLTGCFDPISDSAVHHHGRPLQSNSPWAKQNVLTFDGGGVRGYYSLLHLQYLMKCIKKEEVDLNVNEGPHHDNLSSFSPCIEPKDFSYCTKLESRFLPCHYFDYISGTSTGALITIMLTTLRMSVNDCLREYEELAGQVFGHPRPIHHAGQLGIFVKRNKYATTNLEDAIKDVLRRRGELAHDHDDAMQFRTPKGLCRAIVFASRSIKSGVLEPLWIFRSYDNFCVATEKSSEMPLNPGRGTKFAAWKVARAATAASLYFKPLEIALDDGEVIRTRKQTTQLSQNLRVDTGRRNTGMGKRKKQSRTRRTALFSDAGFSRVNNPSLSVRDELRDIFRDGPKKVANWISIGTARPSSPHTTSSLRSILRKAVAEVGDPEGGHQQMERLRPREFDYYRLNEPNGLPHVEMDDWKPKSSKNSGAETIEAMKAAFHRWVAEPDNQEKVKRAAKSLVQIRRARTIEESRWERFALGRLFICPAKDCYLDSDETWHYRDSFVDHLRKVHRYDDKEVKEAVKHYNRDWQYKSSNAYSQTPSD